MTTSPSNERPILFSGPMVRVILGGRKTQTRRVVQSRSRAHPEFVMVDHGTGWWPFLSDDGESHSCNDSMEYPMDCPYGKPGDRLWVRETWAICDVDVTTICIARRERMPEGKTLADTDGGLELFTVEAETAEWAALRVNPERWRPSIFMPRWASRITLEVTGVRVERLQDISEADAIAEGIDGPLCAKYTTTAPSRHTLLPAAVHAYAGLWDSINAKRAPWSSNPWVWVVEFKRV